MVNSDTRKPLNPGYTTTKTLFEDNNNDFKIARVQAQGKNSGLNLKLLTQAVFFRPIVYIYIYIYISYRGFNSFPGLYAIYANYEYISQSDHQVLSKGGLLTSRQTADSCF